MGLRQSIATIANDFINFIIILIIILLTVKIPYESRTRDGTCSVTSKETYQYL